MNDTRMNFIYEDGYIDRPISAVAKDMVNAKQILEDAKAAQTKAQKDFDHLRLKIVPEKMDNMGITSTAIKGVGRLGVSQDVYAGIVSGETQAAYKWLEDNGHEDLIKDFVHSSTLKAFLKEQVKAGVELPDVFKYDPFERASITGAPKG